MKYIIVSVFITCLLASANAQTYISFNYTSPSLPVVNAGADTSGTVGDTIILNSMVSNGTPPFTYNWSPGNAVIDSTVLNAEYILLTPGIDTMMLTVIDANNCEISDDVIISSFVNINNIKKSSLVIYPNPADEYLIVTGLPDNVHTVAVTFYTIEGIEAYKIDINIINGSSKIMINSLPKGIYLTLIDLPANPVYHKIIIH